MDGALCIGRNGDAAGRTGTDHGIRADGEGGGVLLRWAGQSGFFGDFDVLQHKRTIQHAQEIDAVAVAVDGNGRFGGIVQDAGTAFHEDEIGVQRERRILRGSVECLGQCGVIGIGFGAGRRQAQRE